MILVSGEAAVLVMEVEALLVEAATVDRETMERHMAGRMESTNRTKTELGKRKGWT